MFERDDRNAAFALAGGLAATGLAVVQGGPGVTAIGPVRRALVPRLAGRGRAGHVALTFDDGPEPAATPAGLGHVLPARADGAARAAAGGGDCGCRARDRCSWLGAPVPDAARPASDL